METKKHYKKVSKFLDNVKKTFSNQPQRYDKFINAMKEWNEEPELFSKISDTLNGYPDLLESFKAFEPSSQKFIKTATYDRSKISPKDLICPLCDEKLTMRKMRKLGQSNSIQFHLFSHYSDKSDWEKRLEKLKHEATNYTTYTCDICSKIVKSHDSKAMVKKSMISHLALQHHELRPILEKDSRIDKGTYANAYFAFGKISFNLISNITIFFFYRFH